MFSRIILLAALLFPVFAHAQDVLVLYSGQTVKGKVVRYDENRFSIIVDKDIRQVPAADVHSVYFSVDDAEEIAAVAPTNTPPPPAAVTNKPPPPVVAAETNTAAARNEKKELTAAEGTLSVSDLLVRGPHLDGKLVKLEFGYCAVIREGKKEQYVATLFDSKASMDVEFGKEAYTWFNQLPQHMTFTDVAGRKPRSYYVYGVVGKSATPSWVAGRQIEGCTFEPVGRKTKKGMRGAMEYEW